MLFIVFLFYFAPAFWFSSAKIQQIFDIAKQITKNKKMPGQFIKNPACLTSRKNQPDIFLS